MRGITLIGVLAVAVAAGIALAPGDTRTEASPCGAVDVQPRSGTIELAREATLCLLNRERTSRGLQPLASNDLLEAAAAHHSHDMVRRQFFEHATPDGRTVQDRIGATGYARGRSASTGENIGWGSGAKSTPAAIVAKWMDSPPHRADILRQSFQHIGIGIALGTPVPRGELRDPEAGGATYTTDFGGEFDPSLPGG